MTQLNAADVVAVGKTFKPGWPGRIYDIIPGPDCRNCRNTGWEVMHSAGIESRTGLPRMTYPCGYCGRNPSKFLDDLITRNTFPNMPTPDHMNHTKLAKLERENELLVERLREIAAKSSDPKSAESAKRIVEDWENDILHIPLQDRGLRAIT